MRLSIVYFAIVWFTNLRRSNRERGGHELEARVISVGADRDRISWVGVLCIRGSQTAVILASCCAVCGGTLFTIPDNMGTGAVIELTDWSNN